MKKELFLFLFSFLSFYTFGQKTQIINIDGGSEIGNRKIMIYTPKEYADTTKKFEVVYVFDAQQQEIFDAVHSTIAFQNYGLRPMIVVGIVSENRNKDFLPKNNHPETMQELAGQLGNANYLSDFLEKTLFTYIDKNYRTLPIKIGIGYSNGGTFLNYVMLTNPKLFNVIFSIDANFTYDKGQLVESIKNNTSLSQSNLFYYTCQTPTGENWVNSSKEFNSSLIKNANMIIKQDFFQRETHSSVYQQGVINAFKEYFRYQFFNSKNLIDYFKKFDQNGQYSLSTREINSIAKVYLKNGLAEDAKKILLSFQYKILDDIENQNDLYELFDSGDLYMNLGFTDIAKKYFLVCQKKLEANKNQISADFYNFGKNKIKEKLKLIENNKQ